MKLIHWIMVGLVAIVIVMIILWPQSVDNALQKQAYETQIAILEAEKKTGESQFQEIVEKATLRTQKDSLAIKRYNVEINILKKKVAISRGRVDTIIRDNPELAVFVSQQDSIIIIQGQQIDTLKQALVLRHQAVEDLIKNHDAQARISERIEAEKDNRILDLEKQVKRKSRGSRWLKAGIVGAVIGGLFLGSNL